MSQLTLTAAQVQAIQTATSNGTQDYYLGYNEISSIIENSSEVDDITKYWFQEAANINAGINSNSNLYIRSVTTYGLQWDGVAVTDLQTISNTIGNLVINDVIDNGVIPELTDILENDISGAITGHGLEIGGWGGSFYFWNTTYDPDGTAPGQTVGSAIASDLDELEKFLTVSTAGSVNTAVALSNGSEEGIFTKIWDGFSDLKEIAITGYSAEVPGYFKVAIATRAAIVLAGDSTGYTGPTDTLVHTDGITYSKEPDTANWIIENGDDANNGAIVSDATLISTLNQRLAIRADHLDEVATFDVDGVLDQTCFPAGTLITLHDGSQKAIENISMGDAVLSFDSQGNLLTSVVDKLFRNTTQEFVKLTFDDGRDDLVATPGHHFLTETGEFMEIGHMLQLGGGAVRLVEKNGSIITAHGQVLVHSAETAELFEQAQSRAIIYEGNLAVKHEAESGWATYNFEVRNSHTYIAENIRVHNDSILNTIQLGDTVFAVTDDFKDAAISRVPVGDGMREIVLLDGERFTDVNGGNTFINAEQTFIPTDANADVDALLTQFIEDNTESASNIYDPGNGNGPRDGVASDDIFEILTDDIGGTFSTRTFGGVGVPTLEALVLAAVTGGAEALIETLFAPLGSATTELTYNSGDGDVSITPTGPDSTAILLFILGLDASAELVPGVPNPITGETIGGVTLGDLIGGMDLPELGNFEVNFGSGITQEDVVREQDGDDLVLTVANDDGTSNTMTLAGVYADGNADEIVAVNFADGTSLPLSEIATPPSGPVINGTDGDDIISTSYTDADGETPSNESETLEGLGGNDRLYAFAGDDTLLGGDGDDYMRGYAGADVNDGGEGFDVASYYGSNEGVIVNLETGAASGGYAQGDTFISIEGLVGSRDHDDELTGDAGNNKLYGRGGDDKLVGGDGDDYLRGYEGADIYDGGAGVDSASYWGATEGVVVNLETGFTSGSYAEGDTFISIEGLVGSRDHNDELIGDAGNNRLYGRGGDDKLVGGDGDDYLRGYDGNDIIDGGAGADMASYLGSTSGVTINLTTGAASGGYAEGDTFISIENILASKHADVITGDAGANRLSSSDGDDELFGLDGDDHLLGGSGSDKLDGGAGNDLLDGGGGTGIDYLTGGAGADTFHFDWGEGEDHVLDFQDNIDTIEFDGGFDADTVEDLISNFASQTGANVTFDLGDAGLLVVENTTIGQIEDDVVLVEYII